MKVCLSCNCKNPDDFIVCKNCGKLLSQKDFMTVGYKTVFSVLLVIALILVFIGAKVYDKLAYKVVGLPDKKYKLDVVDFKYPAKWIPLGKVFYNVRLQIVNSDTSTTAFHSTSICYHNTGICVLSV